MGKWLPATLTLLLAAVGVWLSLQIATAIAVHPTVQPAEVLEIDKASRHVLSDQARMARDTSLGWWPFDAEGRQLPTAPGMEFRPPGSGETPLTIGFTSSALWFHWQLRLAPDAPTRWWLVVANPQLDRIDLLVSQGGQLLTHDRGGDLLPFDQRKVPHRHHVFPLQLKPGEVIDLHLRVASRSSMEAPVTLWQSDRLIRQDHRHYMGLGLYFGMMAGMVVYTLFLYAAMRDRVYLLYAGMRLAVGVGLLALSGLGAEFLWPGGGDWNRIWQLAGLTVAGALAVEFGRGFMLTAERMPRLDRFLRLMVVAWLAFMVVSLAWLDNPLAPVLLVLAAVTAGVLALLGMLAMRQRRVGGLYFLLAWMALLGGAALEVVIRCGYWARPDVIGQPLVIGSGLEMLLMCFALAERIRAERRAKQRAQALQIREAARAHEARRASAEKSRLMAAISHDLRQPVYAIALATESLDHRSDHRVPMPTLDQLRAAISSADHLLGALHTMSRLEAGALRPRLSEFSLEAMLERIDVVYGLQARAKGLRWTVTPCLCRVRSDPILLERMLGNLAANAVRYTTSGGVLVACRMRREALLIQVWDTGIGIPDHEHEAIFHAYFRGVPATETDSGVGLGLFIVRQSAHLLGIQVGMRSRPGRGSCFWLRVPLGPGSDQVEDKVTAASV